MKRASDRLSNIPPSATLGISARARELRAEGLDVISFGAGEPDFATPEHVVAAAARACYDPENHKYTASAGLAAATRSHRRGCRALLGSRGRLVRGDGHQRGQAGRVPGIRRPSRPRRRGAAPVAPLGHLPGRHRSRRRGNRLGADEDRGRVQGRCGQPREGADRPNPAARVRLAFQPDRGGLHRGRGTRHRGVGQG